MKSVVILSLALSAAAASLAPAQGAPASDQVKAELLAVYKRSHEVKRTMDSAGYVAVFSASFMEKLMKIMQDNRIPTFREYMSRVADLEKRTVPGLTPVGQRAVATGDRATLTVILPKACGDTAKPQDCRATVDFLKEGGAWKIARERQVGQP